MDAEMQMDAAAEMTKAINSSSMAGIFNSMVSAIVLSLKLFIIYAKN
jgi:hypothetical protein